MSIFKDTFVPSIKDQIRVRQMAMRSKTPQSIQYLNTRNSWVRMTSSVNVNGTNDLAKQYVLKGGTLANGKTRHGVGGSDALYSDTTPSGNKNRLGLRPVPGIIDVDIKSKDAYGSLREVVVKFTCWDIRQLEDLELLYMRPGYTCLIEWGWSPYLDNNSTLQTNHKFFDILNNSSITSKEQIFAELFRKATIESGGNYDAMFGYVKNYNWSMRSDGGYDCTTTIISVGEIIESLKVNYVAFKAPNINKNGVLNLPGVVYDAIPDIQRAYSTNIMAGIFYELYFGIQQKNAEPYFDYNITNPDGSVWNFVRTNVKLTTKRENSLFADGYQTYITLETLLDILNKYVIVRDVKGKSPLIKLSTKERTYDKESNIPNDLLCSAHPLQISVDPGTCIIKSPIWSNGFELENLPAEQNNVRYSSNPLIEKLFPELEKVKTLRNNIPGEFVTGIRVHLLVNDPNGKRTTAGAEREAAIKVWDSAATNLENLMTQTLQTDNDKKEFIVQYYKKYGVESAEDKKARRMSRFGVVQEELLQGKEYFTAKDNLEEILDIEAVLGSDKANYSSFLEAKLIKKTAEEKIKTKKDKIKAKENLKYLNNLDKEYFYATPYSELGIIGNIYINLDYLYALSVDLGLEGADKKEKNEINLYDFLKRIMSDIQSSIGNVSNFDIHVDPIDNVARIIDINYVEDKDRNKVYDEAFEIQLWNTSSIVRSFNLSSQIFPEQSALVAIGAQVGGGRIGMETNTMIDFNKSITDRIIPEKDAPVEVTETTNVDTRAQLELLATNFKILYECFGDTATSNTKKEEDKLTDQDTKISSNYKNSLRDVINYFQNLTVSKVGKNKNIIPVKLNIEMDGIGGLVIGHIFRVPNALLPKGYQGKEGIGGRLGFVLTGIGQKIKGQDWVTSLEAQTIILDSPVEGLSFQDIMSVVTTSSGQTDAVINVNGNVPAKSITKVETRRNIEKAITFFKGKGFTNEQTSGIIGNLLFESELNPNAFNEKGGGQGAYGIAQWRGPRQRMLKEKYPNTYNIFENQLEFVYYEMKRVRPKSYTNIKNSKTIDEAAVIFDRDFEGSEGTHRMARISYGKSTMEIIKKNENT